MASVVVRCVIRKNNLVQFIEKCREEPYFYRAVETSFYSKVMETLLD